MRGWCVVLLLFAASACKQGAPGSGGDAPCDHQCDAVGSICSDGSLETCSEDADGCRVFVSTTCDFGCDGNTCATELCSNGSVEGGEVCDGDTIACSSLDSQYASGDANCKRDCTGYDTSACQPESCLDFDGDGQEVYNLLTCPAGTDVCDSDTNNWTQANCTSCTDSDGDGWYSSCDRYSTIDGPDYCDDDADNWTATGCSTCVDNDGDGYGAGCDRGCDGNDANASVTNDCIPPETSIDSSPDRFVNVTDATVAFSCNEAGCTYECQIDGGGFTGCSSPQNYTGLGEATHTVEVRAADAAGNIDPTPATVTWTVVPRRAHWATIPGGTFQMGDAFAEGNGDESPVHTVTISTFEMYAYEVTNGEYETCVNAGNCTVPGSNASSYGYGSSGGDDPYRPVNDVSWQQAVDFCAWIGGRLPTEAEWEYAARGGLAGKRFPWGDSINCSMANYYSRTIYSYDNEGSDGSCTGSTVRVGGYAANGFGLFDMTGNLWEWVGDWYSSTYYASSPSSDPQGPASGTMRSIRGGSFSNTALSERVADRNFTDPVGHNVYLGFRCAR